MTIGITSETTKITQPNTPSFTPRFTPRELASYHAAMILSEAVLESIAILKDIPQGQLVRVDQARDLLETALHVSQSAIDVASTR